MREFNAGVLLAVLILIEGTIEVISFDLLRAFVSPPMPRLTYIKNGYARASSAQDPHAVYDFLGLVKRHNYPAEAHNVTTKDGYRLVLHRIPGSPNSSPTKKKHPILIQHGLAGSSDSWVLIGPEKDLAFLLADAGYDVWLGNFRGNTYSRSHIVLSTEDPAFWQFSYHEMGFYDLPAKIDYILEQTGHKSLTYVGHSMGTTSSYVLLSLRPEYNKRLRLVISLAPVAIWRRHKVEGLQKLAAKYADFIERTLRRSAIFEIAPQNRLYQQLGKALCSDAAVTQPLCLQNIFRLVGTDYAQLNATLVPYFSSYFPAGMSLRTLYHYYQNLITGEFTHYDHGYVENFGRYGMQEPPHYNITKVTAPVALFYGQGDALSQEPDALELTKVLPNLVTTVAIPHKEFNHVDFLWAIDGKSLLYDDLMNLIRRFKS